MSGYKSFYDERRFQTYAQHYEAALAEDHTNYDELKSFIDQFQLNDKKCLEIGSSDGAFQDMVIDYYGTDIAESLVKYYRKPYRVAEGAHYPFEDGMFDAIWTINVFEHIPQLSEALHEIKRLLKPGGVLLFSPAWQCRPWAADGYAVRPYHDLDIKGKLIKASIPIRDSIFWRSMFIFPKRLARHIVLIMGHRYKEIKYRRLKPNYDFYWVSDSDACNSIDPHDAILWFLSNGFECISHPNHLSVFFVRTHGLIFKKLIQAW
jgi:SAM-dependent methyltransferase